MRLPHGFTISPMRDDEIETLGNWAAAEGWNPGLADLAIAKRADPDCFVALREGETLAGGGSIFSYRGRYGFMGLFIMRADLRNRGLGTVLWRWRRDRLFERLSPGAAIGMDGVFGMVPFYERGGFRPAYRHLRYQGIAEGGAAPHAVALTERDLGSIEALDDGRFPAPRVGFLRDWAFQPGAHLVGLRESGTLSAYGVARPCRAGYKIGPLFAESVADAEAVLDALLDRVSGAQVQIDVPEANPAAVAMAAERGFEMSFGCMRLYHGPAPALNVEGIFAVTSLEFG